MLRYLRWIAISYLEMSSFFCILSAGGCFDAALVVVEVSPLVRDVDGGSVIVVLCFFSSSA